MIIVNKINDNINVSCRNQDISLMYTPERMKTLLEISEESTKIKTLSELDDLMMMVDSLCTDNYKERVEAFHDELTYNPHSKEYFLKLNGVECNVAIPEEMVWRLEESIEKEIDISPIIKNLKLFLRNPKMLEGGETAALFFERYCAYINMTYVNPSKVEEYLEDGLGEELAKEKARTYEVKITQEGMIACFKTSNEIVTKFEMNDNEEIKEVSRYKKKFNTDTGEIEGDNREDVAGEDRLFTPYMMGNRGDAFYCEGPNGYKEPGHFIKIGCVHRLPDWSYVNTNDNQSCVKGLHLGGLSYIASWDGADIHTCFVNPMHIGAIPEYSGDHAIRVLQYYVYGSLVTLNHGIYHSSEYSKLTETEWKDINAAIVNAYSEVKDKNKELIKYVKAL